MALSSGADKRESWERLLAGRKLGALALLRNLRNMKDARGGPEARAGRAGGDEDRPRAAVSLIAAARYAPQWEATLEGAMLKCVASQAQIKGKTALLVDVSGSMTAPLSQRSEMLRSDAAFGLAILLREDLRGGGDLQLLG